MMPGCTGIESSNMGIPENLATLLRMLVSAYRQIFYPACSFLSAFDLTLLSPTLQISFMVHTISGGRYVDCAAGSTIYCCLSVGHQTALMSVYMRVEKFEH